MLLSDYEKSLINASVLLKLILIIMHKYFQFYQITMKMIPNKDM